MEAPAELPFDPILVEARGDLVVGHPPGRHGEDLLDDLLLPMVRDQPIPRADEAERDVII